MRKVYEALISIGNFLQPLLLLAIRLFWGWQFLKAGIGKLEDPSSVAGFFQQLGIPLPLLSVYLTGIVEALGGFCLLIGLASRLAAIPLMITMLVAYLTAHHDLVANIFADPLSVVGASPFSFLMTALLIFVFGPGCISIDAWLKRRFFA